jgi:hypothetical protein
VEQLHREAVRIGKDCIIESIRTVGEVKALRPGLRKGRPNGTLLFGRLFSFSFSFFF